MSTVQSPRPFERTETIVLVVSVTVGTIIGLALGSAALGAAVGAGVAAAASYLWGQHPRRA